MLVLSFSLLPPHYPWDDVNNTMNKCINPSGRNEVVCSHVFGGVYDHAVRGHNHLLMFSYRSGLASAIRVSTGSIQIMRNGIVFTDPLIGFFIEYLPAVSTAEIGGNISWPIIVYLFLSRNLILR